MKSVWILCILMGVVILVLAFHVRNLEDQIASLQWKARTTAELNQEVLKGEEQQSFFQAKKSLKSIGVHFIEKIPVQIQKPYDFEGEVIYPITITGLEGTIHPLFKLTQTESNKDCLREDMEGSYLLLMREDSKDEPTGNTTEEVVTE